MKRPNNTERTIALSVGRALEREPWHEMTSVQAEGFCLEQIKAKGLELAQDSVDVITHMAMYYVIAGHKLGEGEGV